MTDRTCTQCPAPLTGRQQKFCSARCRQTPQTARRIADGTMRQYRQRTRERSVEYHRSRRAGSTGLPLVPCAACGGDTGKIQSTHSGNQRICSWLCRSYLRHGRWPHTAVPQPATKLGSPVRDMRGPLRTAWENGDWTTVQAELLRRTERYGDCRLWRGSRDSDGYARVQFGSKRLTAYRAMATATHNGNIGVASIHHTCANRLCIEPTHLQPVTAAENTAEMLHRRYYLARIAELEAVVAQHDPNHPVLTALPFASESL